MTSVLVTGAGAPLGRKVVARLEQEPSVHRIVALDRRPPSGAKVEVVRGEVGSADLLGALAGVDVVVHLASSPDTETRPARAARVNIDGTRRLLAAAADAGVRHVVALSSAVVYGAWPNNPVPITESAPLRPNAEFGFAVQRGQIEQLVNDWADHDAGRSAVILRPAATLASDTTSGIVRALVAAAGMHAREDDPPKQFVHADDVAAAVVLACRDRLDGVFNVAPDGWVPGDMVLSLAGAPPRLNLGPSLAGWFASMRWRFVRGPVPPGLLPFTLHPVLVANDRLKASGWSPRWTNEEAFVDGTEARWWTLVSPKRRQEIALGLLVAVLGGAGLAATLLTGRALRRRRRSSSTSSA